MFGCAAFLLMAVKMFGCAAFLLMAVKLYNVSLSSLASNLVIVLLMLAVIVGAAAALGWVIARLRIRPRTRRK